MMTTTMMMMMGHQRTIKNKEDLTTDQNVTMTITAVTLSLFDN
jgi:hypothetical protein